jgi:hypothetical protein
MPPVGDRCGSAHRLARSRVLPHDSFPDMSFSRSHRNDRRRRVIRESIASDSEFAIESARAQRKARRASIDDRTESFHSGYRDPGYSQAVRKTCQQRLTQFIPIRAGSLTLVLMTMWTVWGLLLLAHYLLHVRGNENGQSSLLILQLFDVRSPHSIANWMACQLWMLTALVAWMIFRIRQHKLDDYRAKYRIWIVLACIALFSSFDTATSALFLLGQSIDGWTRKEIGYGGWPLVLASYASLVALMGLRLSSELKGTPTAVLSWFAGLLGWACAALLGTGLLKLNWSPGTIDLTVGACWLGGVLLVFQAAGMYLRYCYLQAQKRFIERAVAAPGKFGVSLPSMPRMPWSRSHTDDVDLRTDDGRVGDDAKSAGAKDDGILDTIPRKTWLSWRRSVPEGDAEDSPKLDSKPNSTQRSSPPKEPKRPMRLFGLIPSRAEANERLAGEPISEDDGGPVDTGLTKKPGWFGIGGHRSKTPQQQPMAAANPKTMSNPEPAKQDTKQRPKTEAPSDSKTTKRGWIPSFGRSKTQTATTASTPAEKNADKSVSSSTKKSWLPFRNKTQSASDSSKSTAAKTTATKPKQPKPAASAEDRAAKRIASKIFGWLDGLKLKPPVDNAPVVRSTPSPHATGEPGPKPISSANAPFPSTSSKSSSASPSQPMDDREDEEEGGNDPRYLSKAERKRLRRQQGNDRYAA